jgi:hypothetical protein
MNQGPRWVFFMEKTEVENLALLSLESHIQNGFKSSMRGLQVTNDIKLE